MNRNYVTDTLCIWRSDSLLSQVGKAMLHRAYNCYRFLSVRLSVRKAVTQLHFVKQTATRFPRNSSSLMSNM